MKSSKRFTSLLLAFLMVVLAAGCGSTPATSSAAEGSTPADSSTASEAAPTGEAKKYSVGTGSMGGVLFVTGSGWATVMNNKLAGQYELTSEQTGGQSSNVSMLESGEVELGVGGTATLADAYNGTGDWTGGTKFNKARAMFTMAIPNMTPFTLEGSGITCLSDLNGRSVALGPKGASIDSTFRAIFEKLGIEPSVIHNDTWSAAVSALSEGTTDAVITQQVAPWPSLTELEATKDVSLIQMTDEELAAIQELFPFYTPSVIEAGTYKANPDTDIKTLCEWTLMLASADLPEEDVYNLMVATFDSYDDLTVIHPSMATIVAENASQVPVTWHPGAIKYYEEKGIELQEPLEVFTPKG
jgi:TRAP transporter TAXI family solute receptor